MYDRDKKKFARLYACVMLLLSAMLLLVSSIPVVRLELGGDRSEWFRNGSYTANIEDVTGELRMDMDTAVRSWRYFGELWQILYLQTLDAECRKLENRMETAEDEKSRAALETALTNLREERKSAVTPDREESLHRLTESGKLSDLLCAWDAYFLLPDFGVEMDIGQFEAMLTAFRAVAFLMYLTFTAFFPVFAAFWLIAKAVDLLLHYKKLGKPELRRLSAVRVCFVYALVNLAFLLLFALVGFRPDYRPESIFWLIALTMLACLLNSVCRSIFSDEPKDGFWSRQGLRALNFAAAAVVACSLISLGLPTLFLEQANSFGTIYAQSAAESDRTAPELSGEVDPNRQAGAVVVRAAGTVFVISAVAVLATVYLLVRGVWRFASWKPVKSRCVFGMVVSGALVLFLAAIPVLFGTGSVEKQENAAGSGEFLVLWDAYRVEGSEVNRLYQSRTAERQELETAIARLEEALRDSTGEDTLNIIAEKDVLEIRLARTDAALADLRTHQVRDLAICISGAAVLLFTEILCCRMMKRTQRTVLA